jgi:mono/diheme cytochrome c family protein
LSCQRPVTLAILISRLGILFLVLLPLSAADKAKFFETKVRPVLAKNCFVCHTSSPMVGLAMVSSESLQKGGKSDESLLIQAISHTHPRLKMPPQGQFASAEIADLRTWVEMGAPWPAPDKRPGRWDQDMSSPRSRENSGRFSRFISQRFRQ